MVIDKKQLRARITTYRDKRRYHLSHHYVLNKHKEPVPCTDLDMWRHWMAVSDRVLKHDGTRRTYVATVFLGIDMLHANKEGSYVHPPLLFEVRTFREGISVANGSFATWREAERAHDRVVRELNLDTGRRQ